MNEEILRDYALRKNGAQESFPFGETTLVFKVNNKIFMLMRLESEPLSVNLKCAPNHAEELRELYPDNVFPGWHMNKKHWNTVQPRGLKIAAVYSMIDESYELVTERKKR